MYLIATVTDGEMSKVLTGTKQGFGKRGENCLLCCWHK